MAEIDIDLNIIGFKKKLQYSRLRHTIILSTFLHSVLHCVHRMYITRADDLREAFSYTRVSSNDSLQSIAELF